MTLQRATQRSPGRRRQAGRRNWYESQPVLLEMLTPRALGNGARERERWGSRTGEKAADSGKSKNRSIGTRGGRNVAEG